MNRAPLTNTHRCRHHRHQTLEKLTGQIPLVRSLERHIQKRDGLLVP